MVEDLAIKNRKACTVVGKGGGKSLPSDPGSELRLGGSERDKKGEDNKTKQHT